MGVFKETAKRTHYAGDSGKEIAPFTGRTVKTMWSAGLFQRRLGQTSIASVLSHLKKEEIWLFCQIMHFLREGMQKLKWIAKSTQPWET